MATHHVDPIDEELRRFLADPDVRASLDAYLERKRRSDLGCVLGPDHPDTARGLNSLAALLQAQGELAAVKPLLQRALAIRDLAPGPDRPHSPPSVSEGLALLAAAQERWAGARVAVPPGVVPAAPPEQIAYVNGS